MDFDSSWIVYEDNHLLVLNKPAGLLTQPNDSDEESLEQLAKAWIKTTYQKPYGVFLHAVHRLDKPVSGIVVFGKTSKAVERLNESMRKKECKKIYVALVQGRLPSKEGKLEHYMIHGDFQAQIAKSSDQDAKQAILLYRVIEEKNNLSLVEIELVTGRYHQIRLQMSTIGCPIVGDTKYGSTQAYQPNAIALHHKELDIVHPVTRELLKLSQDIKISI